MSEIPFKAQRGSELTANDEEHVVQWRKESIRVVVLWLGKAPVVAGTKVETKVSDWPLEFPQSKLLERSRPSRTFW